MNKQTTATTSTKRKATAHNKLSKNELIRRLEALTQCWEMIPRGQRVRIVRSYRKLSAEKAEQAARLAEAQAKLRHEADMVVDEQVGQLQRQRDEEVNRDLENKFKSEVLGMEVGE